jgi:hypothetical protein
MGCDCHFYVERWTSSNNYDGPRDLSEDRNIKIEEIIEGITITERWVSADEWEWIVEYEYWTIPYSKEFYSGRNYYLFSILADVRNNGSIDPLDYPRGIPNDCSSGYSYITKQWGVDAHSHSYFTLKELLDVNWDNYKKEHLLGFMKTIERMKTIDSDPNKVRCVFFFDN